MEFLSPSGRSFLLSVAVGFTTFVATAYGARSILGHGWPAAIAGAVVATVLAQSAVFALGMIRFNHPRTTTTGAEGLIGLHGTTVRRLAPIGLVRLHGETWTARTGGEETIESGTSVRVVAVENLVVVVARITTPSAS